MRNMLTMMFVLLINTTVCRADDVIKNGDFSQPAGNDARMPAAWRLPEGGRWQRDLAGGPAEKACLRYDGRDTATAPVVQVCDFCTPNATYELSAMVKSDGQAQPVFRVIDKHTQKQLAVVTGTTDKDWRRVTTSFNTVDADIVVEIYGNPSDISGKPEAPGRCWVADVRIAKAATTPAPQTMPDLGENLALGKPYTMTPPNYSLCADADDRVQLTDGAYTDGHFWTRRTTVGWSGVTPKFVTIDLGADLPVKGVSFSTAAGVAEVHWPTQILIFVSSDGKEWREVADLVALSAQREPLPDYGAYYVRRLWTDQLRTHGRYLQLCVESDRRYTFADEIEVYRGNDEWLASAYSGKAIPNVEAYMDTRRITGLIQAQFRRDLDAVRADIADLPANARAPFAQQADKLAARIDTTPPIPMEGFRRELCEFDAVLPMTDLERDIFKLQAAVWRTLKKPLLRVWWKQRWDPLDPSEEPQSAAAAPVLQVHTMTNEHRADVFNLTNASAGDQRVRMRIAGLPGGTNPDYVKVHEVPSVGTRWFVAVAAALPEAERSGDDYVVTVPSGMTRQVWLSFNPNKLPAQFYQGKVEIQSSVAGKLEVPIHLRVYPLRFPDETSLLLGGWTYTNTESIYGVTLRNRQAVIRHLQERFVNAPWATSSALPEGAYDAAGNMTQKPDTSNLDNWVALWPKAKLYMVFKAVGGSFAGSNIGDPLFAVKVGNWARFWGDHLWKRGLKANQLGVLIVDEPNAKEQYDIITAWAKAIEAGEPGIVTWEDPQPIEDKDCLEMFASVDVLCPIRGAFLSRPDWYRELFIKQQREGRDLWFYNADGPARTFDPFSYYLVQQWHCFKVGAKGSCFWAFGDNGNVSCWNEYPAEGNGPYCPTYLDDESITAAKYMEAIREGVQDYEYLTMLKNRVGALEKKGIPAEELSQATKLLETACDRVMAMEKGANYRWDEEKDRGVADRVRVEILNALSELSDNR